MNNGIALFENINVYSDLNKTNLDFSNILNNSNNQLFYISSSELVMTNININD